MIWPFELEFMQRALAAGLVVGVVAPIVGMFLVQRRLALFGDGMGHIAFAGVSAGLLTGIWPVWTALAATVAAAWLVERLRRRGSAGDLALALLFYSGLALGAVLASKAGSLDATIVGYLFGSILTVSAGEVALAAVVGALTVAVLWRVWAAMFSTVVDEEWSRVAGLPADGLGTFLGILAAVTVVLAMRVVGLLLVASLMVLPVAAAARWVSSFRSAARLAVVIGVGSVIVGLTVARAWDLAPGGSIVLTSALVNVISATRSR